MVEPRNDRSWSVRTLTLIAGGLIVMAIVIATLAVSFRPSHSPMVDPSTSVRATAVAASGPWSPIPTSIDGRYPGGIPTQIDGEPVLVGLAAQARWQDATDDTPFLVGAWSDSHILDTCSGGIGPNDPNPLAVRGCPPHHVEGLPGRPVYADGFDMPSGDLPIIVRVHTRDPRAATCIAEYIDECWRRTVVDDVVWAGDETTAAQPIGPLTARRLGAGVFVMESRLQPDGSQAGVFDDVFTVPIACPAPWPSLLFAAHGDPRYGLVAVFPDTGARESFQTATPPDAGQACLGDPIERPAPARWVGQDNMLVLAFADDAFAAAIAGVLADPDRQQSAHRMTDPGLDRSRETVVDYLAARAAGLGHAWGERLFEPYVDEPREEPFNAGWWRDVFRRHAANALLGSVERLAEEPTAERVGAKAWRVLQEAGVTRATIYRVTYPGSTDAALSVEDYLVIQMPESTFRDWQLIRIAGDPYPPPR